jgi:hypothetical protein
MRNLVNEREGKRPHERKGHAWQDNIKLELDYVNWILLDHDRWQLCIPKCANWKIKIYINCMLYWRGEEYRKEGEVRKSFRKGMEAGQKKGIGNDYSNSNGPFTLVVMVTLVLVSPPTALVLVVVVVVAAVP